MKNKIILGTVQFGLDYGINNSSGKPSTQVVKEILDKAFENDIQLLDTAEAYGDSQEVIGEYHQKSRNRFEIITKFSSTRKDLPVNVKERVQSNLKTLKVEKLYCYMFHNYADFKNHYKTFEKDIVELKALGFIEKLGVSIYTNDELADVLNCAEVDLVQLPFNLLDNSHQRIEIIEYAQKKGVEVHTRSAFLQGLFFRQEDQIPLKLNSLKPYLLALKKEAQINNLSVADLALNYASNQSLINKVLIGVDSVQQLEENIKSLEKSISNETMKIVDEIKVEEIALLNPSNWN